MDMKQLRERIGLTTVDVAYKLGKAESTIRNWDQGRKSPMLDVRDVPALLEVYNCTLEELISAVNESCEKYKEQNFTKIVVKPTKSRKKKTNDQT